MRVWLPGYTKSELEDAQARFNLRFPPDLTELFLECRPTLSYDWRTDIEQITKMLVWPLEGLLFDIEHNDLWLPSWGEPELSMTEKAEVVRELVAKAPRLIPLYSHRYLPADPLMAGNPVFSIYQSDVIYYRANLDHYIGNEADGWTDLPASEYRYIPFWSDLELRNQ